MIDHTYCFHIYRTISWESPDIQYELRVAFQFIKKILLCDVHVFVYMFASVGVHMHESVCICMWRSEVGAKYHPWWFSTYILSDGLSLSPELPTGSLAGQLAPEITPAQYVCGYWRFKWAPSTGRTSVLTLEPFSSPQHWNLARDRMESQLLNDVPSILSWNLQWFPLCVKLLSLWTQCYLLD